MAKTKMSKAAFVTLGYGQVEPNLLSETKTGKILAQLPAASTIDVLENGQFAKYDYAKGEVNFTGDGRWMMVYNEVKVYRDDESDSDFAMIKSNYKARVYSPVDGEKKLTDWQSRFYGAKGNDGKDNPERVTTAVDPREWDSTEDPFKTTYGYHASKMMKEGTTMVPRLVDISYGDIYTTNTVDEASLQAGDLLEPSASGYLKKVTQASTDSTVPTLKVVKVYTMPDGQPGVKLYCIR